MHVILYYIKYYNIRYFNFGHKKLNIINNVDLRIVTGDINSKGGWYKSMRGIKRKIRSMHGINNRIRKN